MKIGDYVTFDPNNDVFCPPFYSSGKGTIGKIIDENRHKHCDVFWVTPLPVHSTSPYPLWAIPKSMVKPLEDAEAMLAILEA